MAVSIVPACPACGASHAPGARFCRSCGAALGAACARCGASLSAGDAFCSQCGERVAGTPTVGPRPESSLRRGGEERKHVTIVFADVAGSSALADRLDPEALRDVMQRYFDAMREEIEAEGGTVEKFIGDAVMAVFGVPVAHEDDPSRALRAADAMGRRLAAVNAGLATSHGLNLQMRVGVNTGEVLTAAAGGPGAALVTGDAVNVAARLQTLADPGDVLLSERTARAARGFEFARRGALDLKGRREPVRALRLVGRVAAGDEGAPRLTAPLVGRSAELAMLDSVFVRSVDERRPHVATVYGDAGVGKSRLVGEFLDRVQDGASPPLVLRGRCLPYGDGVTYWPLAEMFKAYAEIQDTDSASEVLARIGEVAAKLWAPGAHGDVPRTAAMLAYTLGVTDPRAPTARTDPKEVRDRVHAAWRAFFSALASSGPVVVLVEDIHWADPALLDLLDEAGERVKGPVLFVFAARPELTATRPGWGGGRRDSLAVSLDPLPPDDAQTLVRLLLTVDELPSSVRARILERAEGNPFFLEEILRSLIDEGLLRRERGRWRAAPGIEAIELPDSVQGVLASRIDLLAPTDKLVLQAAAVVGRVFWREPLRLLTAGLLEDQPAAVETLSGLLEDPSVAPGREGLPVEAESDGPADGQALEASLRRLEARDLVSGQLGSAFAGQPEYVFKHVLTRDVAYDGIPRSERSAAHARVARWLERTAGDRAPEFGELLAHHYATAASLAAQAGDGSDPTCAWPPSAGFCAPRTMPSPNMCSARLSASRTKPWNWPRATSNAVML